MRFLRLHRIISMISFEIMNVTVKLTEFDPRLTSRMWTSSAKFDRHFLLAPLLNEISKNARQSCLVSYSLHPPVRVCQERGSRLIRRDVRGISELWPRGEALGCQPSR